MTPRCDICAAPTARPWHYRCYVCWRRGYARRGDAIETAAGKSLAIFLFCAGARSMRATAARFSRNPEWRSA